MSTWRDNFRPLIAEIVARVGKGDMKALRQALRDSWDEQGMGPRQYHPYKIWCDEVKLQLGIRKPKAREQKPTPALRELESGGQERLF